MKRGQAPMDAMNIGVNKDATTQERIANGLRKIYDDYKKNRIIDNLYKKYKGALSMAYLRKLADLGFITRMTSSKKNMLYMWSAGDNPDFIELANKLMMSKRVDEKLSDSSKLDKVIEVSQLLTNEGVDKDKINDLTKKIINLFYSE